MRSPNFTEGRYGVAPWVVMVHTMGGSLAGTDSWFSQTASQVSSHYGVSLPGAKRRYVLLKDAAWVNGVLEAGNRWGQVLDAAGITVPWVRALNPNAGSVGIETEDLNNAAQVVTDAEYEETRACVLDAMFYEPSLRVLSSHHIVSPASRANCAGSRWVKSGRMAQLARDTGLILVI